MKEKLKNIPEVPKGQKIFWWIVRAALVICFIYAAFFLTNENSQFYKSDGTTKLTQALAAFGLTFVWEIVQLFAGKTWLRHISPKVQTCINAFMLFGCCICSYLYLYEKWDITDLIMHLAAGVIIAVGSYELLLAMQYGKHEHLRTPTVAVWIIFAVVFISALWEFYEFTVDFFLGSNMQIRWERLIANWSENGGNVTFYDMSGKVTDYAKNLYFTVDGLMNTKQLNSSLYDTMTDMLIAALGGLIAEIVIMKVSFKKLRKSWSEEEKEQDNLMKENLADD